MRNSVVSAVLSHYVRLGGRTEKALPTGGLDIDRIADPYGSVPLAPYVAMFERMAAALDDPLLGARIGMEISPADLGPAGLMMARSGSIRAAISRLSRHFHSVQQATHSEMIEADDRLTCAYRLTDPSIWPRRQDAEFTLAANIRLFRLAFRPDWRPLEVHLEHEPVDPQTTRSLRRLFGCRIRYGAPANAVVIRRDEANTTYFAEDADMIEVLERYLAGCEPEQRSRANWSERVAALIADRLGRDPVTIQRVAAALGIAPRSLQRRLAEEGSSLRQLVRQRRQDLADRHLHATRSRLDDLADSLGYADATTVWRAYRSWTGKSPSMARRERIGYEQTAAGTQRDIAPR